MKRNEKVTVACVRQILSEFLIVGEEPFKELMERTLDEELLEKSVKDYGFTPDRYNKLLKAASDYGIKIGRNTFRNSAFYRNPTVGNFVRLCNE